MHTLTTAKSGIYTVHRHNGEEDNVFSSSCMHFSHSIFQTQKSSTRLHESSRGIKDAGRYSKGTEDLKQSRMFNINLHKYVWLLKKF